MNVPKYTGSCPEGVYEKAIAVSAEHTDRLGHMNIGDFAREMEKVTEEHLKAFGMSREELKADHKIWVISWNSISVKRLPKTGEHTVLYIWPCKKKAGMYPRKYAFYTEEGEPLACAASLFTLMDETTRK